VTLKKRGGGGGAREVSWLRGGEDKVHVGLAEKRSLRTFAKKGKEGSTKPGNCVGRERGA